MSVLVCTVVGTAPAGIVTVGSVFSAELAPLGTDHGLGETVGEALSLVVQPGAVVGGGGGGDDADEDEPAEAALGLLPPPERTTASTIATTRITAPAAEPMVSRRRALARAAIRCSWRRS